MKNVAGFPGNPNKKADCVRNFRIFFQLDTWGTEPFLVEEGRSALRGAGTAACCVTGLGATDGLRDFDQTQKLIKDGFS